MPLSRWIQVPTVGLSCFQYKHCSQHSRHEQAWRDEHKVLTKWASSKHHLKRSPAFMFLAFTEWEIAKRVMCVLGTEIPQSLFTDLTPFLRCLSKLWGWDDVKILSCPLAPCKVTPETVLFPWKSKPALWSYLFTTGSTPEASREDFPSWVTSHPVITLTQKPKPTNGHPGHCKGKPSLGIMQKKVTIPADRWTAACLRAPRDEPCEPWPFLPTDTEGCKGKSILLLDTTKMTISCNTCSWSLLFSPWKDYCVTIPLYLRQI